VALASADSAARPPASAGRTALHRGRASRPRWGRWRWDPDV